MCYFFKVVVDKTLRDQQLKIPPKFVKKCKKNLPEVIFLEVPDGKIWKMILEKDDDGHVWLRNGWTKFIRYYSIQKGYFLVFKHEEKSKFHVCIFDENTSVEIDYPSNHSKTTTTNIEVKIEIESDDDSVQILDSVSKYQKRRKREPTEFLQSQKLKRNQIDIHHSKGTRVEEITKPSLSERNLKYCRSRLSENKGLKFPNKKSTKREKQTEILQRSRLLTEEDKAKAIKRAKAFKSKYPLFEVVIQPTYARGMYLNIPTDFVVKHLGNQRRMLILRNSNGKTWPVRYICEKGGKPKGRLGGGWRKFVRENGVEVGDVCVVELIKNRGIYSLQVNIF